MSRGQRFLLRAIGVVIVASVGLLIYYNLSPNYVDENGWLIEEFWALGLASFGLVGAILSFLALLLWLSVSKFTSRNRKS
ncbi:MAG: DUF3955 domain-containing protein [Micrococcales bacterium]|jgi:hypothetical protein|nr:DUF3955 domain-containing protein [Micrococcales bacterium]MBT5430762.1 DUF3955 domain-containing protein [Micrococcales bacterium]MBT5848137.1 DUF3955 domain-containing protein [Micrococcales bacterium]MBT7926601.1 DUF3955 domain-containing protein [Micrococcales bacterium]